MMLSKFDVAERQLLQGIRLFFAEGDEVSIHTLSEAACQVLRDIGKPLGYASEIRDSGRIRPEKLGEWHAILAKSRNFFKHADRDADALHQFSGQFNDFSLLESVMMYHKFKRAWTPETILFFLWIGIAYPNFIHEDDEFKTVLRNFASGASISSEKKESFSRALRMLREESLTIKNISLEYGVSGHPLGPD